MNNKKKRDYLKTIKRVIGRLNCPPAKVVPNKKDKILKKLKDKEVNIDET